MTTSPVSSSLLILYGSQTGAAKGIAELVHAEALSRGISATLSPANAWADAGLLSARAAIIVMSTTGDGDAPSNAEDFIRFLRRRAQPKNLLSSLNVAVLGLGDTNYSQFCASSKSVSKRMTELGAHHFLPPTYADEAMGLQSAVDPWLADLWPALLSVLAQSETSTSILPVTASSTTSTSTTTDSGKKTPSISTTASSTTTPINPISITKPVPVTVPSHASSTTTTTTTNVEAPLSPMAMMARMREMNAAKARKREADAAVSAAINASLRVTSSRSRGNSFDGGITATSNALSPGREQADALEAAAVVAAKSGGRRVASIKAEAEAAAAAVVAAAHDDSVTTTTSTAIPIPTPTPTPAPIHVSIPMTIRVPDGSSSSIGLTHITNITTAPPEPVSTIAGPLPLNTTSTIKIGTLTPGVQTLFELFPTLHFSNENEGTESTSVGDDEVIPPFSVSASGKFFPRAPIPTVTCCLVRDCDIIALAASNSDHSESSITTTHSTTTSSSSSTTALLSELDLRQNIRSSSSSGSGSGVTQQQQSQRSRTPSPGPLGTTSGARTPSRTPGPLPGVARGIDAPVLVALTNSNYLSSGGRNAERRILEILLDVSGTPLSNAWSPGDALGVIVPNPADVVEAVLLRCGLDGDARLCVRTCGAPTNFLLGNSAATTNSSISIAAETTDSATLLLPTPSPKPPLQSSPLPQAVNSPSLNSIVVAGIDEIGRPPSLLPPWLPGYPYPKARDVLTWCADLSALPKKALLRALGDACTVSSDRDILFFLAGRSAGGVRAFSSFVEAQRLDLRDLFALFPSSTPSLPILLAALPPLQPRFYSLASSPLVDPNTMRVAFNIVEYQASAPGAKKCPTRLGLATAWLEGIMNAFNDANDEAVKIGRASPPPPPPLIRAFLRAARSFVPPAALATPLIMVGPGTGVAPFIGFIEHREARRVVAARIAAAATTGMWRGNVAVRGISDAADVTTPTATPLGISVLIYGNRDPSIDWLFRKDVETALVSGALSAAHVAWSRVPALPRTLVTDILRSNTGLGTGSSLAELILRDKAHFFVCGGSSMAADVRLTLVSVLSTYGANFGVASPLAAEAYVSEMLKGGRYAEDKWG